MLARKNTKVEIPNTVTEIEEYAFMGCSKLKGTLTVPGSIKRYQNMLLKDVQVRFHWF